MSRICQSGIIEGLAGRDKDFAAGYSGGSGLGLVERLGVAEQPCRIGEAASSWFGLCGTSLFGECVVAAGYRPVGAADPAAVRTESKVSARSTMTGSARASRAAEIPPNRPGSSSSPAPATRAGPKTASRPAASGRTGSSGGSKMFPDGAPWKAPCTGTDAKRTTSRFTVYRESRNPAG